MSDVQHLLQRLSPWRQAAVLAGLTVAVFSTTLAAGFVYDARLQILTDPFLHDPRNWWPVLTFGVLRMDVLDFNRPVHLAALMLDAAVWGRTPFGYHLTSVLLHAVNVVLTWMVLCRLCSGTPAGIHGAQPSSSGPLAAAAAAMFFAVHPVVTEAVCEPTFREDLLVAFFTFSGLLLAMGRRPEGPGRDGWRAAACVACGLLAIGSKESGIAAPAVIGAYWLLFRRGEPGWFWPAVIGGTKLVVLGFLAARFLLEPEVSRIFESRPQYPGGSLATAMLIAPRIFALYAQLLVLPINLCADYGLHSVAHLPLAVAVVVLVALVVTAALALRADRRMLIAVTLITVPLLPVSNVIPIYRAAADRYLYLPLAGVAVAVGLLLDAPWLAGRERLRSRLLIGVIVADILLGVGCMARQKVWADQLALWTDTVRKNPVAYTAAAGFAEALREAGRLPEAEQAARRAIDLSGGDRGDPWATLALILDEQGRAADAFAALDRALAIDAKLADPDACVAALAMERPYAEALGRLLARRKAAP